MNYRDNRTGVAILTPRRPDGGADKGDTQPMLPWYVDTMLVVLVVGCSWWALCGHGQ